MTEILPGLVTQDAANQLERLLDQGERNAQILASRSPGLSQYFPAKLTNRTFDATLGVYAYSWSEQTYDADTGARIDHPSANSGTARFNPAYAYGDGTTNVTFPTEVMLRKRNVRTAKGIAYEFPLYCACVSGPGSGSGSGSGGSDGPPLWVFVECCPKPIPGTLYVTISRGPGGADYDCLNGTYTLSYNPSSFFWRVDFEVSVSCPGVAPADRFCGLAYHPCWGYIAVGTSNAPCAGPIPGLGMRIGSDFLFESPPIDPESTQCSPLFSQYSWIILFAGIPVSFPGPTCAITE